MARDQPAMLVKLLYSADVFADCHGTSNATKVFAHSTLMYARRLFPLSCKIRNYITALVPVCIVSREQCYRRELFDQRIYPCILNSIVISTIIHATTFVIALSCV